MSITFYCGNCGKKLKAGDRQAGKSARCSGCGQSVTVPLETAAAARASSMYAPETAAGGDEPAEPPIAFGRRMRINDALDMTPMVDMTFLLMIFFLFTFAMNIQKSLEFPPQEPSDEAALTRTVEEMQEEDNYILVRIDADNTVWVNDVVAPSRQDLLSKLRTAPGETSAAPASKRPGRMLVMAHAEARHETVVMALDVGASAGMEDVRLSTFEEEF